MDDDLTGKYLITYMDNEYYVLKDLNGLLFCLGYSLRHEVFSMQCMNRSEVEYWCMDVLDEEPEWMSRTDLMRQQHRTHVL